MKNWEILALITIMLSSACSHTKEKIFELNKDITRNKVEIVAINDSTYVIENKKIKLLEIQSFPTQEKSKLVTSPSNSIDLDFYLIQPYITGAYLYSTSNFDYLIFESNIPGSSGISANITEVTIVPIKDQKIRDYLSFSSFYSGAELISFKENSIYLSVFKYVEQGADNQDLYCRTDFISTNNNFKPNLEIKPSLYKLTNSGLNKINSSCSGISKPYVTNN